MTPAEVAVAAVPNTPERLHWLTVRARQALAHMYAKIDAGMTTSTAFEIASDDLTRLYKAACQLEGAPPQNVMLDPAAVELQARFALDSAINAVKKGCCETEVRQHFWFIFRKATNPHADLSA